MGVEITEDVAKSLMELFDTDHSGMVNYHEFLTQMFPSRAHG